MSEEDEIKCGYSEGDENVCVDAETNAVSGHMSGDRSDLHPIHRAVAEGFRFGASRVEVRVGRRSYNRCRC